jgi:ABC-type Fe3+ transport system permease subunit
MISQSDIQGRLRLLRYGLIVVVIVAFFVALLVPYAAIVTFWNSNPGVEEIVSPPGILDGLGTAIIATIVTAVICAAIYFGYNRFLNSRKSS